MRLLQDTQHSSTSRLLELSEHQPEAKSGFLGDKPNSCPCGPLPAVPQGMTQGDFPGKMPTTELGYFSPEQLS